MRNSRGSEGADGGGQALVCLLRRSAVGDDQAFDEIVNRVALLIAEANKKIRRLGINPALYDGDDVFNWAMAKLFLSAKAGRLQKVQDDDEFMRLLRSIQFRNILDAREVLNAVKRSGVRENTLRPSNPGMRSDAVGPCKPTHEALSASQDQVERWLEQISSHSAALSTIAELKRDGMSNRQIATNLGLPVWTVKRKLHAIRLILTDLRRDIL